MKFRANGLELKNYNDISVWELGIVNNTIKQWNNMNWKRILKNLLVILE